jgi:hypothetical protein
LPLYLYHNYKNWSSFNGACWHATW